MNTVDWLREFKINLTHNINGKTSWGRVELQIQIEKAYQETLEKMVNFEERK